MYAIVRAGGRQEKVSVGDTLIIDKVDGSAGDNVDLTPLLVVDGKYLTDGPKIKSHDDLLAVAEELVQRERQNR